MLKRKWLFIAMMMALSVLIGGMTLGALAEEDEEITCVTHKWHSVVTRAATHTTKGEMLSTCATCGKTKTEPIAKLEAHTYGAKWTDDGEVHTKKCVCGEVVQADHQYGEWILISAATEQEAGSRERACKDCGHVVTETIPAWERHEPLSTGGMVGVAVSLTVIFGMGGFWISSDELLGDGVRVAKKGKPELESNEEETEEPETNEE